MKRVFLLVITVLFLLGCFYGCGAMAPEPKDTNDSFRTENMADAGGDPGEYNTAGTNGSLVAASPMSGVSPTASSNLGDKIIYRSDAEIETVAFDDTVSDVYGMLDTYNAFIESSYISGSSYADTYYGRQTYRYAEFVIRVPKESFETMKSGLSSLGNVTSINNASDNITEQYIDTESRLTTYRTEESRLLAMLEKAETVDEMLAIESHLADVRYEIESLTSIIRNWDNSINYSTLTLHINEVKELSAPTDTQLSYWDEIGDGFVRTLRRVGRFFTDLFKDIIIALPVVIIVAVVIAVIVILAVKFTGKLRRGNPERVRHSTMRRHKKTGHAAITAESDADNAEKSPDNEK